MTAPRRLLAERLQAAFDAVEAGADPVLRPSEHADFQANGALALAKRLGRNPRELAAAILEAAELDDLCRLVEVSGPGFINCTLAEPVIGAALVEMAGSPSLGVPPGDTGVAVVDYSAPNVAKEMHVGHLRSTIIGDALARVLAFTGAQVVRQNHVGDWGTPFGMLIEHLLDLGEDKAVAELSLGDLNAFYQDARAAFDADPAVAERSRRRVVLLQSGDPETLRLWRVLVEQSAAYFGEVYTRLGVLLEPGDLMGESAYDPLLTGVVGDLDAAGLLVESDGARCVFPPGFTNRQGDPLPLIVQKSDGGFGYAATDLAAIRHRVDVLGARRILYVVGAPQAQHLEMVFAVARLAGWLPEEVEAVHVAFGSVLGTDHKMLKSRAGETVKLIELLEEAVARAEDAIATRSGEAEAVRRHETAVAVGIGAVKYADLSTERTKDYVFDWERMLAFEGNTGPYLQYAHARIASILRRSEVGVVVPHGGPQLAEAPERALGLRLLGFEEAVAGTLAAWSPHRLGAFLYDLATDFTTFYEQCPVLRAEPEVRESRLFLADLTRQVLGTGLGLLGIEAPDRM